MTGTRVSPAAEAGLSLLPDARQELARAMFAEAAAMEPGPTRRAWLRAAWWFVAKGLISATLRRSPLLVLTALLCLWMFHHGGDYGFPGRTVKALCDVMLLFGLGLHFVTLKRPRR